MQSYVGGDNIRLELKAEYASEVTANAIFKALEPDNTGYVVSDIDGKVISFIIDADNAGTLRNAADDLLVCLRIAEEASGLSGAVPDLDGDALLH